MDDLLELWQQRLNTLDAKTDAADSGSEDELNYAAKAAELRECIHELEAALGRPRT